MAIRRLEQRDVAIEEAVTRRLTFLFAPGAGAPFASPWMQGWRRRLETLGAVHGLDYPYQLAGKRAPDRLPVLIQAHRAAFERLRESEGGTLVLIGKSMGSRIGCHVAVEASPKPAALVCFGYPLIGQSGARREAVLLELETPILFVQGTRDPLCPLDELEAVRQRMRAPSALFVVEGGDHSLIPTRGALKRQGSTQEQLDERVLAAVRDFLTPISSAD